ncbi:hypothetical protein, partial [Cetobacterium somerae]|uniref:hypothetical protein n=1 Tax=Cetobacterium somerae TaxID=188913 RepID=UPI00211E0AE1
GAGEGSEAGSEAEEGEKRGTAEGGEGEGGPRGSSEGGRGKKEKDNTESKSRTGRTGGRTGKDRSLGRWMEGMTVETRDWSGYWGRPWRGIEDTNEVDYERVCGDRNARYINGATAIEGKV